ncbi:tRNA (guanine(46)-N(7))-methyltransferase TrmB [Prosthecomicrobium sp. N25]|uniref:tRNA (guanine(46)-N(7))-methyltransferase TrmB n=1 Tax=Prosthecomicrobium sp. N25 TaxID=3129254 RepID=UPI003077D13E
MSGAGEAERSAAFYGRRKGKPLRDRQAELIGGLLPRLALGLDRPAPADLRTLFADPVADVHLEIGFGGGEHLVARLRAEPGLGLIGAEPFLNGMAKALASIERERLAGRVRLHHADAVPLLDWLPPASLGRVDLLYADPWPKKRHWKRRFVDRANLDRIARVLRPGGIFRFASDWPDYVDWTLRRLLDHPAFRWTARASADWHTPWPEWPGTRYEAKALAEGRRPAYLTAERL